ncbi:Very-long-chain 3-oxoacyl-CoA reductase [Grifola frondosa]|uniref:Very-long-chain 3-oxoacyl-CoA reductase n=1 Tax=Grifola frondosa TaxID=5627 RepID=A0A1C7M5P7_GRIFR|nr:Very-long-chain 3-oxoacyl-CoA reductase [Grifola frondosa]
MASIVEVLAVIGVLLLIPNVYRFVSFIWLYFLRPSSIRSYLHGPAPYAIVTGATDGIGKAVAAELYDKAFNLILHGRNDEKMRKVINELRARGTHDTDIRYFLVDAAQPGHDFAQMMEPYKDLNITLVIHNVGGSYGLQPERIDERSEEHILSVVHWNAIFPLFLTRALLPRLRVSAKHGPVLVQFIGSIAGDISPPRLPIYAASKKFLEGLTRGLDNDERYFGTPTGVRFTYIAVGAVVSNSLRADVNLGRPTSETFAKTLVARSGCGKRRVAPYVVHAIMQWAMEAMGEEVVDRYSAEEMANLIAAEEKKA